MTVVVNWIATLKNDAGKQAGPYERSARAAG